MTTWTTFESYVALIVDDVPENLSLLSDALSEAGYTVLVATDGLSALERLKLVVPDIILLDAMMPGIDGFETCRRIKHMEEVRHVPVVFMTGLTETEHVVNGFDAGGIDYVVKPIQPAEVLVRMATHIRSARMMSQARNAIDDASHAAISLKSDHTPLWQTRQAAEWIETYFPGAQAEAKTLPPQIFDWLIAALDKPVAPAPLQIERDAKVLYISLSRRERSRENLLMLEEKPLPVASAGAAQFNLTPRELDVINWLAKGKTNRDIAEILGMSPRTVNKHLEHIFVKLGVETRSAAAALWSGLAP